MGTLLRCVRCVIKIRTNFNLNFSLYCASVRGCYPRKSDASSKQLYSQNGRDVETKCGVSKSRDHRRPSRWAFSNGNNSVLWTLEINHLWRCLWQNTTLEESNEGSNMPAKKSHSKERTTRTLAVIERAQALISIGQSLQKLASIGVNEPTMHRIAEEDTNCTY